MKYCVYVFTDAGVLLWYEDEAGKTTGWTSKNAEAKLFDNRADAELVSKLIFAHGVGDIPDETVFRAL